MYPYPTSIATHGAEDAGGVGVHETLSVVQQSPYSYTASVRHAVQIGPTQLGMYYQLRGPQNGPKHHKSICHTCQTNK